MENVITIGWQPVVQQFFDKLKAQTLILTERLDYWNEVSNTLLVRVIRVVFLGSAWLFPHVSLQLAMLTISQLELLYTVCVSHILQLIKIKWPRWFHRASVIGHSDDSRLYWAAVRCGLLPLKWICRCGWPWRAQTYTHPFLDFDCEKKNICMHPMWIQHHPRLSSSWAMTHHLCIIDHCFPLQQSCLGSLWAATPASRHSHK